MQLHRYEPLPDSDYTRLVSIHPGRFDHDICISFELVPIKHMTDYECLSYTWEGGASPKVVQVFNKSRRETISVTENLALAIISLRYPDRPRVMWIDALCIDQCNDGEKGPQVAQMGNIYRSARVVAWLGSEGDDSTQALNTMAWMGSQVEADFAHWTLEPSPACSDSSFRCMDADLPLDSSETRAIYHLLSRRWFGRMWIRQEIIHSGENAVVMCGRYSVPWAPFRRALLCLYMKRRPWSDFEERLYDRLLSLRGFIGQPLVVNLGSIRVVFGQANCKDPRDRIYALLQFLSRSEREVVGLPDYTKYLTEILRGIMRRWIGRFQSLSLLTQCELQPGDPIDVPSWIPDWSKKEVIFGRNYWRHFASSQLAAACTLSPDGRALITPGVAVADIASRKVIPTMKSRNVKEVEDVLRGLLAGEDLKSPYPPAAADGGVAGQSTITMLEAYARTLLADALAEREEPWRGEDPRLEEAKAVTAALAETDSSVRGAMGPSDAFFKIARAMLGGRQLILCSGGELGIAPLGALEGDEVCVLAGCDSPMVLRRVSDPDGEPAHRIVGECYVLGASEGEAFLGPLPEGLRRLFATDADGKIHSIFEDVRTGEKQLCDPRLPGHLVDLGSFGRRLIKDPTTRVHPDQRDFATYFPKTTIFRIL